MVYTYSSLLRGKGKGGSWAKTKAYFASKWALEIQREELKYQLDNVSVDNVYPENQRVTRSMICEYSQTRAMAFYLKKEELSEQIRKIDEELKTLKK